MQQVPHRFTVGAAIGLSALVAVLLPLATDHMRATVGVLHAQETATGVVGGELLRAADGPGPEASEITKLEHVLGAPLESYDGISPFTPQFEGPGAVPAGLKGMVPDSDLVAVQCALTNWKSGEFYRAMDAIKTIVYPVVAKSRSVVRLDARLPNTDAPKTEMKKRAAAICAAQDSDTAARLIADASRWAAQESQAFGDLRRELESALKIKGDELRQMVSVQLKDFSVEERARFGAAVSERAKSLSDDANGAVADGSGGAMTASRSGFDVQLADFVQEQSAALRASVDAKAAESVGKDGARFVQVAETVRVMGQKVDDYIMAGEAEYGVYRRAAFRLRTDLALKLFDRGAADALGKLAKIKDELAAAKLADSAVLSYDDAVQELAKSRTAIQTAGYAAAETGDENALQNALNGFREKWALDQSRASAAAGGSADRDCPAVLRQVTAAKGRLDAQASQIDGVIGRCRGSSDAACVAVAPHLARLGQIRQKTADLEATMTAVERVCAAPSSADAGRLTELLDRLQSDGGTLRKMGQALEADRVMATTTSVEAVCAAGVAQLEAAENVLFREDLPELKGNLKACANDGEAICPSVSSTGEDVADLERRARVFSSGVDRLRGLCRRDGGNIDLESVDSALRLLIDYGGALAVHADRLRSVQTEQRSALAYCRSATAELDSERVEIAAVLTQIRGLIGECKGKKDSRCAFVGSSTAPDRLEGDAAAALSEMASVAARCAAASALPPGPDLISSVRLVRDGSERFIADAAAFRRQAEDAEASAGFRLEAEMAKKFNVRQGVVDPMAREAYPGWRPPTFGDGDWYLGRGGDYLEYEITPRESGRYWLWVRDYSSAFSEQWGGRQIAVEFDGRALGLFAENTEGRSAPYPKGAFRWQRLGAVDLTAGKHTMRVTKTATTSAAAILDAFWFTTDGQAVPPEKK